MTRTPGPTGRALACQARGASPSRPCPQGTQPPAPEASRPWPHQVSSRVSRLASEGVAFRAQDPPVLALSCALPSRVRELGAGPEPACSVGTRPWVQPKSGAGVAAGATAQLRGAALLWPRLPRTPSCKARAHHFAAREQAPIHCTESTGPLGGPSFPGEPLWAHI